MLLLGETWGKTIWDLCIILYNNMNYLKITSKLKVFLSIFILCGCISLPLSLSIYTYIYIYTPNKRVRNAVLGCNLKNDRMISVRFQDKPFNISVIQVYAPTINAEEAEVEWFSEDIQDLLELTPIKDVLFIIGD